MAPRPVACVPLAVKLALAAALIAQLSWQALPTPDARAQQLPAPPSRAALQLASLGEPVALSKLMMLYLQGFDDQPGVRIAWRELDYANLRAWLARSLELDPRAQYPLFAASELYSAVDDPARTRAMLDFVYASFAADPDRRWPWLAHAALIAHHRLHDAPLARSYAAAIRDLAHGPAVPQWARQLDLFFGNDMNELDSTKALIGALLSSGQVSDPKELAFLERRLAALEASTPQPGKFYRRQATR